ncbi:MAG: hypothetical protein HY906_01680 [Deltaproteobacteria bacterium]|nr:hypothetical protein [Deltaproteobacteria bacterium]
MSARHHKDRRPPVGDGGNSAAERQAVREHVVQLLDAWAAEDSGYDEALWPDLRRGLEEHRISSRPLFDD